MFVLPICGGVNDDLKIGTFGTAAFIALDENPVGSAVAVKLKAGELPSKEGGADEAEYAFRLLAGFSNTLVFCGLEALPKKLVDLVVFANAFEILPNVGVCLYAGGRAKFTWPNTGVGDENAPEPVDCVIVVVGGVGGGGVPNCSGFVSRAGLLAANVI